MMAFLSEGDPSVGVYLTSPPLSLAAEDRMAWMGALFLGSPIPRWITASPRSRSRRASSLRRMVGDSAIERASLLMVMKPSLGRASRAAREKIGSRRSGIVAQHVRVREWGKYR